MAHEQDVLTLLKSIDKRLTSLEKSNAILEEKLDSLHLDVKKIMKFVAVDNADFEITARRKEHKAVVPSK